MILVGRHSSTTGRHAEFPCRFENRMRYQDTIAGLSFDGAHQDEGESVRGMRGNQACAWMGTYLDERAEAHGLHSPRKTTRQTAATFTYRQRKEVKLHDSNLIKLLNCMLKKIELIFDFRNFMASMKHLKRANMVLRKRLKFIRKPATKQTAVVCNGHALASRQDKSFVKQNDGNIQKSEPIASYSHFKKVCLLSEYFKINR